MSKYSLDKQGFVKVDFFHRPKLPEHIQKKLKLKIKSRVQWSYKGNQNHMAIIYEDGFCMVYDIGTFQKIEQSFIKT